MRSALILMLMVASFGSFAAESNRSSTRYAPPPGIAVPDETRAGLERDANRLASEIAELRGSLKDRPKLLERLPDVEIFHKAVDWPLRYGEFFRSNEFSQARTLLRQGLERAEALKNGQTPWTIATGLVVRAYISRIDGSIQPYGLIVPASFGEQRARPHRLDVWLHGRDDHLSELKFLSDRQRSLGEFTPAETFVLHPYGRFCNAFKFAGEADVFEAMDDVRKSYPIDPARVAIRGFSMGRVLASGGASSRHLGCGFAGRGIRRDRHLHQSIARRPGAALVRTTTVALV